MYEAIKRPVTGSPARLTTSGSADAASAGDLLKEKYPHLKLAVARPSGAHHSGKRLRRPPDRASAISIPWIHNVKNTDMVIDIDDEDSQRLLRCSTP